MKLAENLYLYPEQGMLDCNTYVITGNPGVIIDPGNPDYLSFKLGELRRDGVDPKKIGMILNTHLHIDHCSANEAFKKVSGARIALHRVQKQNYRFVVVDGARLFGLDPQEFTADIILDDGWLESGNIHLELLPSPGHSPECICFYQRQKRWMVCGDVLFEMNTGRVDLPGGDGGALKRSIESLARLEIEYLLPGHMGVVTPAAKVAENFNFIRDNVFPWL